MRSLADSDSGTRERILRVARELLQTRSFLGFSFQDIADQIGIRKASLYHHFASKESLGVEVIRGAAQQFKEWSTTLPGTPQDKLNAYFTMYRKALRAGTGVCPAGSLTPGWDNINDELREAAREIRRVQIVWLAGVMGALRGKAASAVTPAAVFAGCQGGMVAARMTGHPADFDEAVAPLKAALGL